MALNKSSDEKIVKLEDAPNQATEQVAKQILPSNSNAQLSGKKVRVTFHEQEGEGGSDAIFTGLNEASFQIPRGVPVEIPLELMDQFENCKVETAQTKLGGGHTKRLISRFNYTVHGPV